MKKIITLFLMIILIISLVPIVVAPSHPLSRDIDDEIDRDDDRDSTDTDVRRVRPVDAVEDIGKRLKKVPGTLRKLRETNLVSERRLINKGEVVEIKERLRACKNNDEEDCKDLRREVKLRVKHSLERVSERVLNVLEKLKERVEGSDIENKDAALSEINAGIDNINDAKEDVVALTRESTREEIKNTISELRSALKEARELIRKYHAKARISGQRLENAINKFMILDDNIGNRLDRFEERGFDFSDLRGMLEELKKEIENAQGELDSGNKGASLEHLSEAHGITIKILKEFRAKLPDRREEEEIRLEFKGLEPSEATLSKFEELKESFADFEGEVELRLKIRKQDGEITVDARVKEGELTEEQEALWNELQDLARADVEGAEGDDVKLELEFEKEVEVEEEEEEEVECVVDDDCGEGEFCDEGECEEVEEEGNDTENGGSDDE